MITHDIVGIYLWSDFRKDIYQMASYVDDDPILLVLNDGLCKCIWDVHGDNFSAL
jgi:hypothetical protein